MKQILFLLILLFPLVLLSSHQDWVELSQQAMQHLEQYPEDDEARLYLGYYLMQSQQPLLALREYRFLVSKDPENLSAQAGILYALNNLKQYDISKKLAKELLSKYPDNPLFHNHLAYVYLKSNDLTSARWHYQKGLDNEPFERIVRQISYEGLGWSYRMLGDFPKAKSSFAKAESMNPVPMPVYGTEDLNDPLYTTSFSYARPSSDKETFALEQSYKQGSYSALISFEEFRIEKEHFRYALLTSLGKSFEHFDSRLITGFMKGDDKRVYPGKYAVWGLTPKIYLRDFAMYPKLAIAYSDWKRFSAYQADLGAVITYDKFSASYRFSDVFQDNLAADADSSRMVHNASFGFPLFFGAKANLSYAMGDNAWHIDPFGNVSDTFTASEQSFGCALYIPLSETLMLTQYNQYLKNDEDWNYLFYIRLSASY